MKKRNWLLSASLSLALTLSQSRAQEPTYPTPTDTAPGPELFQVQADQPGGAAPATPAPATPTPADQTAAATPTPADLTTSPTEAGNSPMEMIGDFPPCPVLFRFTPIQVRELNVSSSSSNPNLLQSSSGSNSAAVTALSTRGFKVADNQSAAPMDRVYFSFNDYENLWNKAFQSPTFGVNPWRFFRKPLVWRRRSGTATLPSG
jgi:hypothetical protein